MLPSSVLSLTLILIRSVKPGLSTIESSAEVSLSSNVFFLGEYQPPVQLRHAAYIAYLAS